MNFLGAKAKFPLGPFVLSCRRKLPVVFVYAMIKNLTEYEFYATEPIVFDKPSEALAAYVDQLEIIIKKYPYQWFNFFDFWE